MREPAIAVKAEWGRSPSLIGHPASVDVKQHKSQGVEVL